MTAAIMDERSLVLLRRKLEALSYTEGLEPASAPLVARLLDDLVRTTDSYRAVKLQSAKYAQEVSTFNTKVRAAFAAFDTPLHSLHRCLLQTPDGRLLRKAAAIAAARSSTSSSRTAAGWPTRTARSTRSSSRPASAATRCRWACAAAPAAACAAAWAERVVLVHGGVASGAARHRRRCPHHAQHNRSARATLPPSAWRTGWRSWAIGRRRRSEGGF